MSRPDLETAALIEEAVPILHAELSAEFARPPTLRELVEVVCFDRHESVRQAVLRQGLVLTNGRRIWGRELGRRRWAGAGRGARLDSGPGRGRGRR